MAVPYVKRLVAGFSFWRPRFVLRAVHVEFVVDRVALRQVFLRVLRFSPASIIHHCSIFTHVSCGGWTMCPLVASVPWRQFSPLCNSNNNNKHYLLSVIISFSCNLFLVSVRTWFYNAVDQWAWSILKCTRHILNVQFFQVWSVFVMSVSCLQIS
jgi:hypothetical protein